MYIEKTYRTIKISTKKLSNIGFTRSARASIHPSADVHFAAKKVRRFYAMSLTLIDAIRVRKSLGEVPTVFVRESTRTIESQRLALSSISLVCPAEIQKRQREASRAVAGKPTITTPSPRSRHMREKATSLPGMQRMRGTTGLSRLPKMTSPIWWRRARK